MVAMQTVRTGLRPSRRQGRGADRVAIGSAGGSPAGRRRVVGVHGRAITRVRGITATVMREWCEWGVRAHGTREAPLTRSRAACSVVGRRAA